MTGFTQIIEGGRELRSHSGRFVSEKQLRGTLYGSQAGTHDENNWNVCRSVPAGRQVS